jgi:hypothetical protein
MHMVPVFIRSTGMLITICYLLLCAMECRVLMRLPFPTARLLVDKQEGRTRVLKAEYERNTYAST